MVDLLDESLALVDTFSLEVAFCEAFDDLLLLSWPLLEFLDFFFFFDFILFVESSATSFGVDVCWFVVPAANDLLLLSSSGPEESFFSSTIELFTDPVAAAPEPFPLDFFFFFLFLLLPVAPGVVVADLACWLFDAAAEAEFVSFF